MVIYKNKMFITNSDFPNTDFMGNADLLIPDSSELAEKIIGLYPNFDFVFDDNGNIFDVIEAEHAPLPPEPPSDHDRLEALEAAFIEFVSEVV